MLLYGCETWRMTLQDGKRLDTFLHRCLRRILKIYWPMRITNEEIKRRAGIEKISEIVQRLRWAWLGHVLRMDRGVHPRIALTWEPDGRRKRGRPRETWRRTIQKEMREKGLRSWTEAVMIAADRIFWKRQFCRTDSPNLGEMET